LNEKKIGNHSHILDYDSMNNTMNLFYVDLGTWNEYVSITYLQNITDSFHQHLLFSISSRLAPLSFSILRVREDIYRFNSLYFMFIPFPIF
jgi:hypothetical protein